MSKMIAEKQIASMSPKQRKQLEKQLKSSGGDNKSKQPPRPKSGPGLLFFVIYGIACAGAGIYVDRNHSADIRMWLGQQADNLSGFGTSQSLQAAMENAGYGKAEQSQAAAWVSTIQQAKRDGRLNNRQLEQFAAAEVPFQQGAQPSRQEIENALETLEDLAGDVR